jgi:hypothetical protein
MWFELKTRCLEKRGVFILLKACTTGFFHGKTASPKFQFSSPGRRTWGIFNANLRTVIHILDGSIFLMNISSESPMRFPHNYVKSSVGITLINRMFMLTTFEENVLISVEIFYSTCSTFPEHSRQRRPKEIYLFRVLKCSRLFLPIIMFVLLMMPHVGPMIRQYNVFYSILLKMFISGSFRISWLVVRFPFFCLGETNENISKLWIDKFPWVVSDENAQEMYCKYCRKFPHLSDRKDALTRGTKNLRVDKHQEHLLCVKHWFKELDDPQWFAKSQFVG